MTPVTRLAIGVALLLVILVPALALLESGAYGWTLFIVVPILLGSIPVAAKQPASAEQAANWGALTIAILSAGLLVFAYEGLICILLAQPLVLPLGALGGWLTYHLLQARETSAGLSLALILPLASLSFDRHATPPVFQVHSSIVVNAPPEQVWKYVIAFPDLPQERDWLFHTGLAYPIRAHIDGTGPNAIRYCEFSTGPFIEPITVWDQPHLLRFRVTQNPAPLEEWSPFRKTEPKHLHGYLVSRQGQFQLTALPYGRTLLEGTTWYSHGLYPATYWRWWSDFIIHRIHLRVLNHVRDLAEGKASA